MVMRKQDPEITELEERLADAQAQIESLQATAADAEARAATVRESEADLRAQLAEHEAARNESAGQLDGLRNEVEGLRLELRDATAKYRAARLAAAPDVPGELVPELATIEEIDREFDSAKQVIGRVRERIEQQAVEERRSARVPAGSPGRRPPDLSTLSASEKIRAGLQQLSEREGR
jgi:chromosome segregation ATPase